MAENLSKKEAVRQALKALGNDATPTPLQDWIKKNLNIEMTLGHISTTKGDLLKSARMDKPASPPPVAPVVVEEVPKAAEEAPADLMTKAANKSEEPVITKYEAVRRALAKLGKDAKPLAIQSYVKEHFNIEMTPGHAKTNKGKILREAAAKKSGKKAEAAPPAAKTSPAAPAPTQAGKASNGKKTIELEDILTLRKLVDRVGPAHLQTLIDVMSGKEAR
jgi:hypothetical protein